MNMLPCIVLRSIYMQKQVNRSLSTENCYFLLSNLVANDLVDDPDAETVDPVQKLILLKSILGKAILGKLILFKLILRKIILFKLILKKHILFKLILKKLILFKLILRKLIPFRVTPFQLSLPKLNQFKCKLKLF